MAWLNQKKKKKYVLLHGFGSCFSAKFNTKSHFNMIFKFNIIVMNINKWMCFLEMVFFDKLLWSRFLQKHVVFLCLHVLNVNVTIWKSISFFSFSFVLISNKSMIQNFAFFGQFHDPSKETIFFYDLTT